MTQPVTALLVHLVEVDVAIHGGRQDQHRHSDQTEAQRTGPDRSCHGPVTTRSARIAGMDDREFEAALDDLFSRPPEDFVNARNALVRRLKSAKRREDAETVN